MDELERAAARLSRAAEWAGFTVVVLVTTFLVLAISVGVLIVLWASWLDEIGTPV